jgi:hypothetical protein
MKKHTIFVGAVLLVVGMAAGQAMRADGVASEPMALGQLVSPLDLMKAAQNLPIETVDSYV